MISYDERLLKNFYLNKGYYNVSINSSFAKQINTDEFELIFNIEANEKVIFKNLNLELPQDYDAENFSEKLSKKRVELGLSQNRISNRLDIIDEKTILYKDLMSKSVDTDYTEAITKLSANMLALEAAQSTFAKVSQLSLFNYM